jgi:hypothetical protein
MVATTVWHGTPEESQLLNAVLMFWCSDKGEGEHCTYGLMGVRTTTCAAHVMLRDDQRALDGLLFGRRVANKYLAEEGVSCEEQ